MKQPIAHAAFTLVELAIVLVIIGLIVGGVLVGQDLIKAAEIRSVVSDIEEFNAAAGTFRNKYDGLPGDLLSQRATQFGLTPRDGANGQGDGNAVAEGCATRATAIGCETALFWVDLTDAQLISDAFTVGAGANDGIADGNATTGAAITTTDAMARFLPSTALRDSSFYHVYPQAGRNHFYIGALQTDAAGVIDIAAPVPGLTVLEAKRIDEKMDNGAPTTGIVKATDEITATGGATIDPGTAGNVTGACVEEGATAGAGAGLQGDEAYNTINEDFANELNCNLFIRASF